jgi:TRAP-type uncharacterized transport system substrate-binding protein
MVGGGPMSRTSRRLRGAGERLLPALGLLAVLAGSAWLAWNAWEGPAKSHRLKATGGRLPGTKQRLAVALARASAGVGVELTLGECPGSIEALDEVNDGRVDLALVQGGLDSRRWTEVRQVAALHVEPLQLAVRGDLAGAIQGGNLRALRGKSINLGEPGSGSDALARRVLEFAGLRPSTPGSPGEAGYRPMSLSHQQLGEITSPDRLPDAALTVASLPTPVVRHLVERWGYRLVPLPFGEAFALEDLVREADPGGPTEVDASTRPRAVLDRVHLHETQVPAFTYGVEPAVPPAPLATFGARVLVVANRRVSPEAVKALLGAIYLTDFAEVARPPLDPSLLDLPAEFPPHPGTLEFTQRNKPLIVGDAVDFLEKTSSLLGALLGGLFVTWQWARRRYRRRRELGFEAYLLKVTAIEREALDLELASRLELAPLLALQAELGRLKAEALGRFTQGELEGEGLMSGFLTHANDARDYLARLILHARSAVEKQARRQGLSPEAAWDLATGGHEPPIDDPASNQPDSP